MGATAEELKADIEAKREELGEHLEALGDHVSPAQIVERKKVEYRFRLENAWHDLLTWAQNLDTGTATAATTAFDDPDRPVPDPDAPGGPRPLSGGWKSSRLETVLENPVALAAISAFVGLAIGASMSRRRAKKRTHRSR